MSASAEKKSAEISAAVAFQTALSRLVREKGHGTQTALANAIGKSRMHVHRIVAGDREASSDVQEDMARYFGFALWQFLCLGEAMAKGETALPYFHAGDPLGPEKAPGPQDAATQKRGRGRPRKTPPPDVKEEGPRPATLADYLELKKASVLVKGRSCIK